jgi:hypothetical protein
MKIRVCVQKPLPVKSSPEYMQNLKIMTHYLTEDSPRLIQDIHEDVMNVHTANTDVIAQMLMHEMQQTAQYLEECGDDIWYTEELGNDLQDTALDMIKTWKINNPQ